MIVRNSRDAACCSCGRRVKAGDGRVVYGSVRCDPACPRVPARRRYPGREDVLQALWRVWEADGRSTVRDVAAEAGRDVTSVYVYLRALVKDGRVIYSGPGTYRPTAARPARYVRVLTPEDLASGR